MKYTKKIFDDIVAWYNEETNELEYLWVDHGNTSIPITNEIKKFQHDWNRVVRVLLQMNVGKDKKNYICCGCGQLFRNPPSLTHFAANYCPTCSEAYKNANGRTCSICHQPLYLCVC